MEEVTGIHGEMAANACPDIFLCSGAASRGGWKNYYAFSPIYRLNVLGPDKNAEGINQLHNNYADKLSRRFYLHGMVDDNVPFQAAFQLCRVNRVRQTLFLSHVLSKGESLVHRATVDRRI